MALLCLSMCGCQVPAGAGPPAWAWYLAVIHAIPPRLSLVPCWLKNSGWSSRPGLSRAVLGEVGAQQRGGAGAERDLAGVSGPVGQRGHRAGGALRGGGARRRQL